MTKTFRAKLGYQKMSKEHLKWHRRPTICLLDII